MTVGFVGLGIMGSRMAARLLDAGHEVIVHNRTREKADALLAAGAQWGERPAEVGKAADILFTMLADPQAVEAATSGVNGFLAQLKPGSLWVECSTTNPSFAREMAEKAGAFDIHFVDAPVMGSKDAVANAQAAIFAGGDAADVDAARPYLAAFSREVRHLGPVGAGISLKLCNNYLLGQAVLAFSEALVLGEALGLERSALLDSLLAAPMVGPYMATKRKNFESMTFPTSFPLKWLRKDLEMVSQAAYEAGAVMPACNAAKEIYALARQSGLGEEDYTAIYKFLSEKFA